MKKYTVTLEEDPATGDVILPFPEEMLTEVGWEEGDVLVWKDNQDGTFSITKKPSEEKEWILVETVSQFRQRYMVEVPKGKADWALETVSMNEAKEFSQKHLGETIVSHRVMTEEEALALSDKDNDYGADWTKEQKLDAFFTFHTCDGEKVE